MYDALFERLLTEGKSQKPTFVTPKNPCRSTTALRAGSNSSAP